MSYIGNQLQSTNFVTDIFTGDAVTTAFTLSRPPASVVSIIIFIDGVKQSSSGIYTLLGTTLNFTAAPPNNAVIEVIHLGVQSLVNVPSLLSVTADALADGAVTGPKIGPTAINANNIVNGTITGTKLAANTVTGGVLGQNAVSSNNIISSITLTTPNLGTPASGNLSSCTSDGTNKVGYRNIPAVGTKTSSYTLTLADVGEFVELGTGGSIVVPASVFAAGDVISIFNNTSGSISCTCSAVTTFYKGGTDADINSFSVTTRGVATILFISATVAVVTGNLA